MIRLLPPALREVDQPYGLLAEAENLWMECLNNNALQPKPLIKTLQANWDRPLYEQKYKALLEAQTTDDPTTK